jgi:hypothetical protein
VNLISHPFRLAANGAVATVEDGTDEAAAEAVAVVALTIKGERDLVPDFGVTDPSFDVLSVAEVNGTLDDFAYAATVTDATVEPLPAGLERVALTFTQE